MLPSVHQCCQKCKAFHVQGQGLTRRCLSRQGTWCHRGFPPPYQGEWIQLFYHVCLATAALCQHRGLTFVSPSGDVSDRNLGPRKRIDWQQQHEQLSSDEVWSFSDWKTGPPFDMLCFCSFRGWYLWSANIRNLGVSAMISPYSPKMHAGPVFSIHYYAPKHILQQWSPLTSDVLKMVRDKDL